MNLTDTIIPRSDQLNAEDFLTGARTFTVERVSQGTADQPVNIVFAEEPDRAYRPGKSMRRVLVAAWGAETDVYAGRRMTLYCDPSVKWAGQEVGGIRLSHLSNIDKPLKVALTVTRGKREPFVVQPLTDASPRRESKPADTRAAKMVAAFADFGVTPEQLDERIGRPAAEWSDDDLAQLRDIGAALKAGTTTVVDEFGRADA